MESIIVHQDIDIHDSKMEPKGLDPNGKNIAHLRALKKDLISKRRECQEDINEATGVLDEIVSSSSGWYIRK